MSTSNAPCPPPSAPSLLRRRSVLQLAAAGAAAHVGLAAYAQGSAGRVIRIGTTFDNSGVEKANGSGMFAGSSAFVAALNKAYRILYRNRHDHAAAIAALGELAESAPDVKVLLDFITSSQAGIHGA